MKNTAEREIINERRRCERENAYLNSERNESKGNFQSNDTKPSTLVSTLGDETPHMWRSRLSKENEKWACFAHIKISPHASLDRRTVRSHIAYEELEIGPK